METNFPTCSIGSVAEVKSGFAFKSKDWKDSGIPVVKIANVKDGRLQMSGCSYVAPQVADAASEYRLNRGDILIAMTGYIGDVALVRDEQHRVLNQRVGRFSITAPEALAPHFFFYLLRCDEIRRDIQGLGYGSAQPNVSPKLIHGVEIPLPPIDEQRAIAEVLGSLDEKIELNRRMNRTLEQTASAIFKSWFVDFEPVKAKAAGATNSPTMPQKVFDALPKELVDSPLGPIPRGWCVAALSDHTDAGKGLSYKGSGLATEGVPLHNLNSIYEGGGYKYEGIKFYTGEYKDRHMVRPGDLLVTNTEQGFGFLLIGCPAIVPKHFGDYGLFTHHLFRLTPLPDSYVSREYLYFALMSTALRDQITGCTNGTTVNMLAADGLARSLFVVPPVGAVRAFGSVVTPMLDIQEYHYEESMTLGELRDALLPKLLSGEVRCI